ncbi:MAG TPA: SurA N-terminal domain-containing protein [Segeticoccus sp.]|uniref:SurA N-terminal domain-containing protein n=1 Tax=Segeticoccus sp. TaxID=2706531 RepID=UPI002D7FD76D|nr:SurA N-terminal domain-containing protein [Segeticoccus sp.]HET8600683.1 SurA N-terminal domain-containing protein [Segeticoccus sp.]
MTNKLVPAVCLAAALVGVSACGADQAASKGHQDSSKASASASDGQGKAGQPGGKQSMPKPDLTGIPSVVATVNGTKISKGQFVRVYTSQFQQLAMQSQMSGQKLDQHRLKKQVAQSMVGSTLLTQAADKSAYKPSSADVDHTLTDLAQQNGMKSGRQLVGELTKHGQKKSAIMAQVKEQTKVNHLIVQKGGSTTPTTQELKQAYQQLSQQGQGSKTPSFQKIRPQLTQQLEAQKRQQAAQKVVQQLRRKAHVTINI